MSMIPDRQRFTTMCKRATTSATARTTAAATFAVAGASSAAATAVAVGAKVLASKWGRRLSAGTLAAVSLCALAYVGLRRLARDQRTAPAAIEGDTTEPSTAHTGVDRID